MLAGCIVRLLGLIPTILVQFAVNPATNLQQLMLKVDLILSLLLPTPINLGTCERQHGTSPLPLHCERPGEGYCPPPRCLGLRRLSCARFGIFPPTPSGLLQSSLRTRLSQKIYKDFLGPGRAILGYIYIRELSSNSILVKKRGNR